MAKNISVTIKFWKQNGPKDKGHFDTHELKNIPDDTSFLEALDIMNEELINEGKEPFGFAANIPDIQLPIVEGVRMNQWFSFPSGHTTSFFALAFVASILATSRISGWRSYMIQLGLFLLAALGGYSRIYLSQHFTMDVCGGIVVGLLITMVCYVVLNRFEGQKWYNYRVFGKKMP